MVSSLSPKHSTAAKRFFVDFPLFLGQPLEEDPAASQVDPAHLGQALDPGQGVLVQHQ